MEIANVFGLPAHPLLIHLPVIGIPLLAIAVLAYVLLPRRRAGLMLPVAVLTVITVAATVVAAGSGEKLQSMLPAQDRQSALLHQHTELGDQTRIIVILFGLVTLAYLYLDRRRRLRLADLASPVGPASPGGASRLILALGVAAVLLGGVSTVWDIRTGHSGAKSAWEDVATSNGGQTDAAHASEHP